MSAAARWTARPAIVVERLAPVERSYGVKRVSAPRTVTCSAVDAELLGGDLRERRPRALAHLGRPDEDDDAAVGLEPADRARDRVRAGREQPDGDAAPDERRLLGSSQPTARRDLLDVADEVGVERLAAGAHLLARRAAGSGGAARAGRARQRRATSSTCDSPIHCRCVAPKARYEPAGARFV